jgi:Endonuclease/Exonuclease/phosphatase family
VRPASTPHRAVVLGLLGLLACAGTAGADQTLLGRRFRLTDREPADAGRRRASIDASERVQPVSLSGDPTLPASSSAALLQVLVEGATPGIQTFTLPPGTSSAGRPFWRPLRGGGLAYVDRHGENGPVTVLRLRIRPDGRARLRVTVRGDRGPLDLVPPGPGTRAWVTLALGEGERYCVRFGPDGVVRNDGARSFAVHRVTERGCPPAVAGDFLALTYNVAGLPEGISGSHPAVNTAQIAPLLNAYDLVLMQESWKTPDPNPLAPLRVYHEILEAGSLHPFKSVPATQPLGTDPLRPSALLADGLNRFSRFPFGAITRERWAACFNSAADCLALKGFSMARTTIAPGVTVDVYDLHMEAGSDPQDDVLRDQGITQLSTFIQAHSAGRPVIVGGDFNLHTDEEPDGSQFQRLLAETGLVDVCAALACPQPGRIDKFLFRSTGAVTLAPLSWHFETDVFHDAGGEPLSDHDALAVRFAWTVAGS